MRTKTCSRCGATKPLHQFGRDRARRDGLRSQCRSCNVETSLLSQERHGAGGKKRHRVRRGTTEKPPEPPAPSGRVCADPTCPALLSRWNPGDRCGLHERGAFDGARHDREIVRARHLAGNLG